ncbi:uncharacterized protein [Typha angustifolia]|uniref:uncharacterized protein n=1 Tax=Typha angustifolia TaxID=59011 RepID=UPI003C2BF0D6
MLRHNVGGGGSTSKPCKIRKRGCSSLSSAASSSALKKNRLKRAILVGRRGGSTTPIPAWKTNAGSSSYSTKVSETSQTKQSYNCGEGLRASISARKLATALWQMNGVPSAEMIRDLQEKIIKKEMRRRRRGNITRLIHPGSQSTVTEISDQSRISTHMRIIPVSNQKSLSNEQSRRSSDLLSNASGMEISTSSRNLASATSAREKTSHLNYLNSSLTASRELLKVLVHVWGPGEKDSSVISLMSALCSELDQAHVHVHELIREHRSRSSQASCSRKCSSEERKAWKNKEQERIRDEVQSIMNNLEKERNSRKRAERLNKKLGMALTHMETSLLEATKELERERRSREIVERVCGELVRGIGEDKAEVEEMRRESVKVQEEIEKEREMLQLADEWREERVQMKLSEARHQFEEKNAAIDQLRNELEAFLTSKLTEEARHDHQFVEDTTLKDQQQLHRSAEGEEDNHEDNDEIYSEDSGDLPSIELNMDSNSKSYSWSHVAADRIDKNKSASIKEKLEMRSNCEIMSKPVYSSDGSTRERLHRDVSKKLQQLGDELGEGRLSYSSNLLDTVAEKLQQDAERYNAVKGLRNHMLAGYRYIPA